MQKTCKICSKNFEAPYRHKKCCSKKCRSESARITMIETNKKFASSRQRINNSMWKQGALENMIKTKCKNGTFRQPPKKQGGNGRILPLPVRILNEKLRWKTTYIVRTGLKTPYPYHYKLEIANEEKKICIEVDGPCNYSRKEESKRKQDFLESLEWKVLRFKNKEILENLNGCIEKIYEAVNGSR